MNPIIKDRPDRIEMEEDTVYRLKQAYKAAKQSPDHKSVFKTPEGYQVYILVEPLKLTNSPKRTKEQIEAAIKNIEAAVGRNEKNLKKKGLTLKDVLKTLPKIRADYNKEHYGVDPE